MGLLDKMLGTRPAKPGARHMPAADLRAALLRKGEESATWQVREGAGDTCDLVAEMGASTQIQGGFSSGRVKAKVTIKMKFDEAAHEVRALERGATTTTSTRTGPARRSWGSGPGGNGPGPQVGYPGSGQFGQGYGSSVDDHEMRDALRDVVNHYGWGWKAVLFRL